MADLKEKVPILLTEEGAMMEEKKQSVPFNGVFSQQDRENLRAHRKALHLSQEKLAEILEVKWETERSWENGKSSQCRSAHILLLQEFLSGKLDQQILERQEFERMRTTLRKCLEKSMLRYFEWSLKIFKARPEAGRRLLEELRHLVNQEIVQFFGECMEEMPQRPA